MGGKKKGKKKKKKKKKKKGGTLGLRKEEEIHQYPKRTQVGRGEVYMKRKGENEFEEGLEKNIG